MINAQDEAKVHIKIEDDQIKEQNDEIYELKRIREGLIDQKEKLEQQIDEGNENIGQSLEILQNFQMNKA